MNTIKNKLHPRNIHKSGYDFVKLCKEYSALEEYVFINQHQITTIDFSKPKAVKALNTALLRTYYNINFWIFSDKNLTPPIPGRVDYIHYLADLLKSSIFEENIKVLDIGTGASCIYPILGNAVYHWKFVATETEAYSLKSAKNLILKNQLTKDIEIRTQLDKSSIFKGIIKKNERFHVSMCNPPFFASKEEAVQANSLKVKGLNLSSLKRNPTEVNDKATVKPNRNFSGTNDEIWYKGGEKAFLHNYLYQSSLFKSSCFWFTTLVSNKKNLKSMYSSLGKLGATEIKTIPMQQGNKISRIVAWTFLSEKEQKNWNIINNL
jgi:23S rRNA (adenine1618-N6)-methyltransferase